MVQVFEKKSVDLETRIVEVDEGIEESLIDKKSLRNQAIKDNKDFLSNLGALTVAGVSGNIALNYFDSEPTLSLIFNALFALNMLYFTYMAYKSIKMSYDFLLDKYENSID